MPDAAMMNARYEPPRRRSSTTRSGSSGCATRRCSTTNSGEQHDARDEERHRDRVAPARRVRVREAVDQREQAGRGRDRAGQVDPRARGMPRRRTSIVNAGDARPGTAISTFTYIAQRHDRYSVSTPPMIRPTAPPAPAIAPNTPNALGTIGAGRERRREQRQRGRREQRAEDALQRAGRDEHVEALGRAADRRGGREADQADDEDVLAAEAGRRSARRAAAGCRTRARTP